METSKLEQLLEALVNGETVDITPSSRHEEYLLALLKGETVDKIPQSRLEVYLQKLCEIGLGDGTSVEAVLQALEVTKNGNYTPARGVDGFKSVTVNVPEPVLQDKNITENGIYTADEGYDGLDKVTVEVVTTGGGDDYLEKKVTGTLTEYSNDRITDINGSYAFAFCDSLSSINFPNLIAITGNYAFGYCHSLSIVSLPTVKSLRNYTFAFCSTLTSVNLPALSSVSLSCQFVKCSSLTNVSLPKLPVITSFMFKECVSLTSVSFPAATRIDYGAFSSCTKLSAIRLMASQVCTLDGSSVFTGTGLTTTAGSIYVPSSLVSSYKNATNWAYFSKRIYGV